MYSPPLGGRGQGRGRRVVDVDPYRVDYLKSPRPNPPHVGGGKNLSFGCGRQAGNKFNFQRYPSSKVWILLLKELFAVK
jgi:hypothetical protein